MRSLKTTMIEPRRADRARPPRARSSMFASTVASPPGCAASSDPRMRSKASRPPETGSERVDASPPMKVSPTGSPLAIAIRASAAAMSALKASFAPGAADPR